MSARQFCSCVLGIVLGGSTSIFAQEPSNLVVKRDIVVDTEKATDFVLPIITDADGNIYARYGDGQQQLETISKISPAGRKLLSFSLVSVPGLAEAKIETFSVSEGKLFVLAGKKNGSLEILHIVVFALDGTMLSNTKCELGVQAGQIAVLTPNRFIIAGRDRDEGSIDSKPKTVILNNAGQTVDNILLESDVAPTDRATRTTANGAVRRDSEFEMSLVGSSVTAADDGNAYLMRQGRSDLVFVITADGAVVHRFKLESPSNSSLKEIKVAKHRIAALFVRGRPESKSEAATTFVRTYDADSGKLLSSYILDPIIPNLLAAYDGNLRFTFIGPKAIDLSGTRADEAGRLRIFQVEPR